MFGLQGHQESSRHDNCTDKSHCLEIIDSPGFNRNFDVVFNALDYGAFEIIDWDGSEHISAILIKQQVYIVGVDRNEPQPNASSTSATYYTRSIVKDYGFAVTSFFENYGNGISNQDFNNGGMRLSGYSFNAMAIQLFTDLILVSNPSSNPNDCPESTLKNKASYIDDFLRKVRIDGLYLLSESVNEVI
jgi:hypothetical protein